VVAVSFRLLLGGGRVALLGLAPGLGSLRRTRALRPAGRKLAWVAARRGGRGRRGEGQSRVGVPEDLLAINTGNDSQWSKRPAAHMAVVGLKSLG